MNTHARIESTGGSFNPERTQHRGLALVVIDLERPRLAAIVLQRAIELTNEVDLHVVGRISGHRQISAAHRGRLRDLLYELAAPLPHHVAVDSEIRIGDQYSVVVDVATEHRPTVVVVGASSATGVDLVAIADTLAVPVLVARPPVRSGRAVAASDARLDLTPVLGSARRILGGCYGSITLFHAATPECRHATYQGPSGGHSFDRATCERLLALQHLGPTVDDVRIRVEPATDAVHAILEFVECRAVDMLAIGYRQRPSLGYVRHHTTARVIDGSDCSVLVIPIARGSEA